MDNLFSTVGYVASQLPVFVVWIVGIVLCFTYWNTYRKAAMFTLIAIIIEAVNTFIGILSVWLPSMMTEIGWTYEQLGTFFMVKGFLHAILNASAWGLILAAVFKTRDATA
ncbi:hypothetical protein K1X84_14900 [bacterium]|nr:hypothetical protein [bacterium]